MTDLPEARFLNRSTPPHVVTLVLIAGLAAMSMSTFLPSLPRMSQEFGTSYDVMQFAVAGYLAVTAVIQLFIGPLADRYGRRVALLICQGIFILASLGCALAPNVEIFMMFRMLQAAVAVGIGLSRAVVRDMYERDQAASMIGYVTMGMALVPMIAPMVGGALDQVLGWRAVFVFLALAGAAILALTWADLGETNRGGGLSFRQQISEYPELLTSRRFWGYVFAAAFTSGSFFAFLGGAPYVATTVFGLSSFWTGLCLGAPAIGYATGNFLSARYTIRKGINWMIRMGGYLACIGLGLAALLTLGGFESAWLFFGACTFVGLGNGLVIPNASAGMLSVRPHLAGTASGLGAAIMVGGGAALSTLAGVLIQKGGGSLPLIAIMLASVFFGLLAVVYVDWREKQLGIGG
ncbi:MAG: multidrug effflux MFS transporter [Silicimonas sp.]|nr:multidrug effflux MFS transporter [Silicimonas sp.]